LDPFKDEIHRLLKDEPALSGQRTRELIAALGFDGGKTIVDDYLREVRRLFVSPRTFQRTVYRPAWPDPKGLCRRRLPGYSRAGAGALIFSRNTRICCWGSALLVVAGRAAADAGVGSPARAARLGRPSDRRLRRLLRLAAGRLALLRAARSAGQGRRQAAAGLLGAQLRARPAVRNELDFQLQLDDRFESRANPRKEGLRGSV
jgi:hypothetical protein